ncbi:Hypothetical predicted protein [Mytilus galloprovincialis]|uniref:Heat shock 70 kDa protein 12A n=1 Tax=Mytilus galloprovincialis TaxID=29158 RepID=A0A8B6H3L6_MYTGA|nr:Hypothetical predicted protein [Mytilus galloprovincialis]
MVPVGKVSPFNIKCELLLQLDNDDVFRQTNETDFDGITAKAESNIASLFQTKKTPFVAVGAIDFGTTYSGCAFSTVQEFKTNPLKIDTLQLDITNASSFKTPTALLLTPEGRFHSFGATAENEYVTLAQKEEANSWYYFNRFKMQLYTNKELTSNMVIKEVGGKTMKAMLVFAFCIEYIKDKVLSTLKNAIYGLDDNDVHWVITVPAIWNDQARKFMIEASAKAGIEKENLTLALEPECAAMYCRYLAMDKKEHGDNVEIKAFDENAKFMVVDLGGGTIDITMAEVLSTGQLREIYNATGGPWGGNYINDQIIKTLKDVIGWELIRNFQADDYDDYLLMLRQVEQIKRGLDHNSELTVSIPEKILQNIKVKDSCVQYVQVKKKYITLSASLMQKIFSTSVDSMIKHVENLLQKKEACSVSTILLVGGYSASNIIQRAFREKFDKKYKIIIPLTPDMIVLKGAVIAGHRVEAIVGRMAKYHYGLGFSAAAVSGRSISIGDHDNKTFFSIIKKGQKIIVGEVVTQYEIVLKAKSTWANLEMYTTKDDNPRTIIDMEHFTKIGNISVKLPQFKRESILILTISYDETEFKVVATDKNTGRCFVGTCEFLEKESNQNEY